MRRVCSEEKGVTTGDNGVQILGTGRIQELKRNEGGSVPDVH